MQGGFAVAIFSLFLLRLAEENRNSKTEGNKTPIISVMCKSFSQKFFSFFLRCVRVLQAKHLDWFIYGIIVEATYIHLSHFLSLLVLLLLIQMPEIDKVSSET